MADAPPQTVTGPAGPMPGARAPDGQTPDGAAPDRSRFDPARFAAIRAQLCAPGAAAPDPATLPEGLRTRLSGTTAGSIRPSWISSSSAPARPMDAPQAEKRAHLAKAG
ncbi:hypothetical protein ACFSHP_10430 [Novosphingobium panipatense]